MLPLIRTILDTAVNNTRAKVLICIFLIVATFCVYSQVQDHEFINFDDGLYITNNLNVQAGLTSESVKWAFTTMDTEDWSPVNWLSHILDYQLYGLNPKGHYLTNLFLHIANALILLLVLSRMTGKLWQSAFVAAIFAFHSLNVESVAWLAERKNVLSTLFWLMTMWAYIHYAEKPTVKRYGLVFLFFAMGLMSKPMLVTLPFVLLLLDYWPLRRLKFGQERGNNEISEKNTAKRSEILQLVIEKNPLIPTCNRFKHCDFSLRMVCIRLLGALSFAGTPYQRNGFIPRVFGKDGMAKWTVDIIRPSRIHFGCMERNLVWHGIGGHNYYFNQAY